VWRTGCPGTALPRSLGAPSTGHDRLQAWRAAQVFERLGPAGLLTCDPLNGLAWAWQAMDGAMTKAPLGGNKVGNNLTARSQLWTKRSVLTDGHSLPLGIAVDGAHRHDRPWVDAPLEAIIITRPEPPATQPPHRCLDTGYDDEAVRAPLAAWSSTAHLRHRGEEAPAKRDVPGYRARRWVVERTHAWMNRVRRLLIRWEKTVEHYLAWRHVACAWITFRAAELFG
jgi:putative transposase